MNPTLTMVNELVNTKLKQRTYKSAVTDRGEPTLAALVTRGGK